MDKAVVVMSGGLDSVVLAYYLKQRFEILPIAFDYGQRNEVELGYAYDIAERLETELFTVNLQDLSLLLDSGLTSVNRRPADGTYGDTVRSTFVPNRNAIFLSIAWGYAISKNAICVAYGTHGGEGRESLTPDCTSWFRDRLEISFQTGNKGYGHPELYLYAPFIRKSKREVVCLGADLSVPFEQTWSCYNDGLIHCGTCGACSERKIAFKDAGVLDPTEYAK